MISHMIPSTTVYMIYHMIYTAGTWSVGPYDKTYDMCYHRTFGCTMILYMI